MFAKIKTIYEIIKLLYQIFLFFDEKINEYQLKKEIEKRKDLYLAYKSGDKEQRLKALRDLQK